MTISPELSTKIRNLTFFSILGVLLIHSYNGQPRYLQPETILAPGTGLFELIQFGISNSLTRFVIPLLFLISGYLFFYSASDFPEPYGEKLLKRFRTVLRPYFLWNFLGAATLLCLGLIPWIREGMPGYLKNPSGEFWAWSLTVFPLNFPLWYLRDLFIVILLAPTLEKILRAPIGRWVGFGVFFLIYVLNQSYFFLSSEAVLFFSVGGYLGLKKWDLKVTCPKVLWWVLAGILGGLVILQTYLAALGSLPWLIQGVYRMVQILGVTVIWIGYDIWIGKPISKGTVTGLSFYVFVGHQPLMILLIDPMLNLFGKDASGSPWSLGVYFLLPLMMALLWLTLGALIRRFASPLHRLLTGNRG